MKWRLREKVLLLSMLAGLLPFTTTNLYWYFTAQDSAQENAKNTLSLATVQATDKVNDYLNSKLLGFLAHSQGAALLNGDDGIIEEDLVHLLLQDPDIQSLSFVEMSGMEHIKVDRLTGFDSEHLIDVSNTDAFKIASYKFGKEYIGPVQYGTTPHVQIAVPVAYPENAQSLKTFSSANTVPRNADDVRGVLIGDVSLSRLISNLNSIGIYSGGYVYLVDKGGHLISYKNQELTGYVVSSPGTEVARFIAQQQDRSVKTVATPEKARSVDGDPVLGNFHLVERTGWAVVSEIPETEISEKITSIQLQAVLLSLLPLSVLTFLSLYFARKLINPIHLLVQGTQKIAAGKYDEAIAPIQTGDELEQLASAYNEMADKIKKEQNSLTTERNTLSTVLTSVVDGIIALDARYNVMFLNHAVVSMLGVHEDMVQGKLIRKFFKFIHKEEEISIEELCKGVGVVVEPYKLTIENVLSHESHAVSLLVSALPVGTNSDIRYILAFYDISKEQEFENMKLDFVSMAAHELRTPLTAIKGYLSYLNEEVGSKLNEEELTYLSRVMISSDQLSSLIENLLNVTKIERGVLKLDLASFSMEKLIDERLMNLQEVASQKHITVTFERPKVTPPEIVGDAFRIGQVFTNLVSNAINYTQPDGWVKISMENRPDGIAVHIQDNGQGIPKSALPHLFTKFYRVGGALEQGSKGTGLGLFISKSIIDRHKGQIWVESIEGQGSTFSFLLPKETI